MPHGSTQTNCQMDFQRQNNRNKIQSLVHIFQCGGTLTHPTMSLWATAGPSEPFLQHYGMIKNVAGKVGGYEMLSILPHTTDSNILQRITNKIHNAGINVGKV